MIVFFKIRLENQTSLDICSWERSRENLQFQIVLVALFNCKLGSSRNRSCMIDSIFSVLGRGFCGIGHYSFFWFSHLETSFTTVFHLILYHDTAPPSSRTPQRRQICKSFVSLRNVLNLFLIGFTPLSPPPPPLAPHSCVQSYVQWVVDAMTFLLQHRII